MLRSLPRRLMWLTFGLGVLALLPLTGALKAQPVGRFRAAPGGSSYVPPGAWRPIQNQGTQGGNQGNNQGGGFQGDAAIQGAFADTASDQAVYRTAPGRDCDFRDRQLEHGAKSGRKWNLRYRIMCR